MNRSRSRLRRLRAIAPTRSASQRAATPLLSIVSPVYCAEEIVAEFVRTVTKSAEQITTDFEIVLVEDGSPDDSWLRIQAECARDARVKGVKLSRNFGQHQAITAGLDLARGRRVVVMDCDLQDDPSFLPALYATADQGYDVVLTQRPGRAHSLLKNAFASAYTFVMNRLSGQRTNDPRLGGYSLLTRRVVNAFRQVRDVHRHYLVIVQWLGFRTTCLTVTHRPRPHGRSSYTFVKLLRHATHGLVSYSNRMLYASVFAGFVFLAASFGGTLIVVTLYFTRGFAPGWPSLVVLILVSTGLILLSLGILGLYVAKIFEQVRPRPLYLVETVLNASAEAGGSRI